MSFESREPRSALRASMRSSSSSSAIRIVMACRRVLTMGGRHWFGGGLGRGRRLLEDRQGEAEDGALARRAGGGDRAVVALDDLAAECEADPGAGVLAARVQALERAEDARRVLRLEADAVVGDADLGRAVQGVRVDAHARGNAVAVELDRVGDQVLQQLTHLRAVGA